MNSDHKGWKDFLKFVKEIKETDNYEAFMDLMLTAEEKESLSTRFLIVMALLSEKASQREIAQSLGVSIAKITRGSNELKRISSKLKAYLIKKSEF